MSYAIGDEWEDPIALPEVGMVGELAPLTIKDLACPTWGLGRKTSADGTVITTIGSPWLPIIAPPMEVFSLDPTWALFCTGILTAQLGGNTFALYDPPIALTRGSGLIPAPVVPVVPPTSAPAPNHADSTTVPDNQGTRTTEAAKPASSPVDPAEFPARTETSMGQSPSLSVAIAPPDPAEPKSLPVILVPTPTKESGLPVETEVPQPVAPANSAVGAKDPLPGSLPPSPDIPKSLDGDPQAMSVDPKLSIQPSPEQGGDIQPQNQGLGAIIYNAFGKSGAQIGGVTNEVKTIRLPTAGVQRVSVGGGQFLSVDPSGLILEGKTYSVGGPALTLSNNIYTIVPQHDSGNRASNDDDSLIKNPAPFPDTLMIAGQTVTPDPTGIIIAGFSVLPGGSAVTISNTPVSLDPSRILVVGSSSFSMPVHSIFTVGTQSFTANPTGFTLNGATISPGAAAQTVDGTILSLGYSGRLAIGTSTYSLPTPLSNDSAIFPFTIAGQTFTPNPSAFSIAGTTILAGGSPVTLAGTIISLGQSGALVIGSSTVLLPTPTSTLLAITPVTLAGQTFTPNPSAFSIAGTTISAGGPAVTIAGTVVSLRPSGTLIVGSSTISLLAPQTNSPTLLDIDGLSVQAQSSFAIVDGMTISPGAPGIIVDEKNVSLEAGGATLDVGTGRFALPTESVNKSAGVLAFEGGQGKGVELSLMVLLSFSIGGSLMLMV